jgi:hypothetical protein
MSGDGIISVRLPRSLLGAFRATAEQHGITMHELARRWTSYLSSLSPHDLRALKEPLREIGWRVVDVLTIATRNSSLTNSTIIRRLLHAVIITNDLEFVQHNERWHLQITKSINGKKSGTYNV